MESNETKILQRFMPASVITTAAATTLHSATTMIAGSTATKYWPYNNTITIQHTVNNSAYCIHSIYICSCTNERTQNASTGNKLLGVTA